MQVLALLHCRLWRAAYVEGGLLLDVVVGKGSSVLELLTSEDQSLLVRGLQREA